MHASSGGVSKGGSMHIADLDRGMLGANGIVEAGMPLAVGAGLTCAVKKTGGVSVGIGVGLPRAGGKGPGRVRLRWAMMRSTTAWSVMKLKMRKRPRQVGQARGSISRPRATEYSRQARSPGISGLISIN